MPYHTATNLLCFLVKTKQYCMVIELLTKWFIVPKNGVIVLFVFSNIAASIAIVTKNSLFRKVAHAVCLLPDYRIRG